jgi:hypothetical protein
MENIVRLSEPTVQQDETPQPPRLKPEEGEEGENPFPELEQLNDESFLLRSFDPHPGQTLLFSDEPTFCSNEKVLLHILQTYS